MERVVTRTGGPCVEFNGQSFRCKVKTGQEGLEDFMRQIRQKCGIPEEKMASLNLTYRCKDPNTGSQMTLEGVNESAFDAAVLCSAAQDKKKHEKRQRRLQQLQQQQQQQDRDRSCEGRDRRESNSSAMSTSSTVEGAIEAARPTVSGGDPGEADRLRQLSYRSSIDSAAAAAAAEGDASIRRASSEDFTAYRRRLREGGQAQPPPLSSSLYEPSNSTPPASSSSSADGSAAAGPRGGMAAAPRRSYQQRFMPSFSSFSSLVRTGCLTTQSASLTTGNMTTTNR